MNCPRCAQADVTTATCPGCGIIVAKWKGRRPLPAPTESRSSGGQGGLALPILGLVLGAIGAVYAMRRPALDVAGSDASRPSVASDPSPPSVVPPVPLPLPSTPGIPNPPPVASMMVQADTGVSEADGKAAALLAGQLGQGRPLATTDARVAEDLLARHPDQEPLRKLLEAVLVTLSHQERKARRFDESLAHLRQAIAVNPGESRLRSALVDLLLERSDWLGAEAAVREWLALVPRDPDALRALAFALLRQDRNREAEEALVASLDVREEPIARALLTRIRTGMASEKGMTEQQLAYFHVRYDGEAHEDVGRAILRALERHHSTLVRTFDHQPAATIPVILFSRQGYYDSTGAPAWSGGHFDTLDGRIRVPIGGLTASLTPDMDETLVHELTHAFVNDRTRGMAPRDLHEGLAQYMEGKRAAAVFSPAQLQALAAGTAAGVGGFYAESLSFVEFLVAERGQRGINDLLRAMAQTGNVDEAYRQVYGRDREGSRRAWRSRIRQQYGA
jgi:tetratricopeptide (TPR) repeat protein